MRKIVIAMSFHISFCYFISLKRFCKVFFCGRDFSYSVVFYKNIQNVFWYKCRHGWSEKYIFNSEWEKGEQNTNSLLLIPWKNKCKRKFVYITFKCICKSEGDLDGSVWIVTLSGIEKTGNSRHLKFTSPVFNTTDNR